MVNRWTGLCFQRRVTAVLLFVLACGSSYAAQENASYGIAADRDVMIPMRDGVRLAADIYRPARGVQAVDGKFPSGTGATSRSGRCRAPSIRRITCMRKVCCQP
ncbi:MAG TPA: hypothetical protein VKB47_17490 [Terracidiphilus sp.]|nr:hypothetical protein [Terracidiphilus sp.]